ncbi:MAG TPA: Na+/H+ antiporter NhaA [Vicinamibacterales bacterium]|nr:Na+/H+ antiporter NhaA [Vicinamibacterales bacterium]
MKPKDHKDAGPTKRRGLRHHVRTSVPRLSRFAVEHLALLPLGALIAMVWVNTAPESYYSFTIPIAFAVNDVAMVLFFALMTKEVVEATAPGGVLHPWRRAMLPVVASIGAAVVPALIHLRIVDYAFDEPMLSIGWPATLATDLAVVYFVARIIFGMHPVIPFLLLLGIASDALGFVTLALYNQTGDVHLVSGALILAGALGIAAVLRRSRVRSFWPYLLGAGSVSWFGFFWIGLHPALALVPIMPFLPHAARDPGFFVDASPKARDTLSQFEVWWRYPAQFALFFFGLVNAGVPMGALEAGTWGLPIAVIVGKPLGVLIGVGVAVLAGLHLPHRVGWRELIVGGFIAAMGFSVGLFFCDALFPTGQLRSEMRMGVVLSLLGAPLALVAARILRVGRFSAQ